MHRPPTPESRKAELEGLIGLGVVIMVLFMGTVVFAASLGLVDNGERPTIFARIVMFCFGGFMLGMAAFIGWRVTAELVDLPPQDYLGVAWGVVDRILKRIDLHSALAATTLAPLVWAYLTPHAPAAWWRPSADSLIALIPLEFLVIHGFPFLVFLALLVRGTAGKVRWFWIGVMLLLILFYGALAWQEAGGSLGLLGLLWLIAPNILAFLKGDDAWHLRVAAGARWLLRLVTLFGLAIILEQTSLRGEGNLLLGAAYFFTILFLELFRIFELPIDIADHWAKIPEARRRHLLPRSH